MTPTSVNPVRTKNFWWMTVAGNLAVLALTAGDLVAGTIPIPNGSFEVPETVFADPANDFWQESPKPGWYNETNNGPWEYLAGVFLNQPPAFIDNMDGNQGAFLFALPGVALFQDYDSVYGTNTIAQHDFNAKFEAGKSYQLTVGVIGGGGGMSNGVTMELSLYYRDAQSNRVTVAATTITNSPTVFSNNTHLLDFSAQLPVVKPDDAWADQHIGVQMLSTVGFDATGGYWDLDNVRLTTVQSPILQHPAYTNGEFQFTLLSEPGLAFEVLAATNVTVPRSNWISVGMLTNVTGTNSFTDAAGTFGHRFYQARQLP